MDSPSGKTLDALRDEGFTGTVYVVEEEYFLCGPKECYAPDDYVCGPVVAYQSLEAASEALVAMWDTMDLDAACERAGARLVMLDLTACYLVNGVLYDRWGDDSLATVQKWNEREEPDILVADDAYPCRGLVELNYRALGSCVGEDFKPATSDLERWYVVRDALRADRTPANIAFAFLEDAMRLYMALQNRQRMFATGNPHAHVAVLESTLAEDGSVQRQTLVATDLQDGYAHEWIKQEMRGAYVKASDEADAWYGPGHTAAELGNRGRWVSRPSDDEVRG